MFLKPPERLAPLVEAMRNLTHPMRRKLLRENLLNALPPFLYKYYGFDHTSQTSIDRLRQIILDSRLWLSSPVDFNDPFDMSSYVDYEAKPLEKRRRIERMLANVEPHLSKKEIQSRITDLMLRQDELILRAKVARQTTVQACGVCCFTPDPRNLLMWSHYANQHKGLVLQFEVTKDINTFLAAIRVDYDPNDNYPKCRWVDEDTNKHLEDVMLRKSSHWEYEDERRIIAPTHANKALDFISPALSGIIFGCRTSDSAMAHVKSMLTERSQQPRLFQARKHESKYELLISRIPD